MFDLWTLSLSSHFVSLSLWIALNSHYLSLYRWLGLHASGVVGSMVFFLFFCVFLGSDLKGRGGYCWSGLWVVVLSSSMLLGFVGSQRSPMFGSSIAGFLGCSNWWWVWWRSTWVTTRSWRGFAMDWRGSDGFCYGFRWPSPHLAILPLTDLSFWVVGWFRGFCGVGLWLILDCGLWMVLMVSFKWWCCCVFSLFLRGDGFV